MRKSNRAGEVSSKTLFDQANEAWDQGKNKRAFKLFLQAAESGHGWSENSLGYFFDHGIGVRKDESRALEWYKKAARHGDVSAYANIGLSYRNAGNRHLAKKWLEKARRAGDGSAAVDLAKLVLERPGKSNIAEASKYLKVALKSKSIDEESREEASELLAKLGTKKSS